MKSVDSKALTLFAAKKFFPLNGKKYKLENFLIVFDVY